MPRLATALIEIASRFPGEWTAIAETPELDELLEQALFQLQQLVPPGADMPRFIEDKSGLLAELCARKLIQVRVRRQRYSASHELLETSAQEWCYTEFSVDGFVLSEHAANDPGYSQWTVNVHGRRDPVRKAIIGYDLQLCQSPTTSPLPILTDLAELSDPDARVAIFRSLWRIEPTLRSLKDFQAAIAEHYDSRLDARPSLFRDASVRQLRQALTEFNRNRLGSKPSGK